MCDFGSGSCTFIYKLEFYFALKAKVHYSLCKKDIECDLRLKTPFSEGYLLYFEILECLDLVLFILFKGSSLFSDSLLNCAPNFHLMK